MDPMAIVSSLNVKRMAPKGYRKSINGQKSPQVSHKKVKPPPPSTAAGPLIYGDVGERGKPQGGGGAGGGDNGRKGNESNGKGIAIFDADTNENNAAVTRRDEPPVPQRNMDLIFSSGSTQQQPKAPKPPMVVEGGGGGRAPGREFLRSISSVASSPVSQLPGGTNSNSSGDEKAPMPKMSKKELKLAQNQLNKLTQINIHLHALFSAVEHGHLEKARTILESTDVNVNSVNSDGLSPLDVALLSNNRPMTKMLQQRGAKEAFQWTHSLGNHLGTLLRDAEQKVRDLSMPQDTLQQPQQFNSRASFTNIIANGPVIVGGGGSGGGAAGAAAAMELEKQLNLWERRVKGLRRMLLGWDQTKPPEAPVSVFVDVIDATTVSVKVHETTEGPLGTKFRVQWSTRADFSNIVGECELIEWTNFQGAMGASCAICQLTQGRRYYIRACLGNMKGWGAFKGSTPDSVVPSSWRDVENKEERFHGKDQLLDDLMAAARLTRPEDQAWGADLSGGGGNAKKVPKKKTTIKQLFSAASKFQKNLKRGLYLACVLYHEDKVLFTNEDFIPVIEVDETYPSCLLNDYHWLMKVACMWDEIKGLRLDMERNATATIHFRTKLIAAALSMQSALCITDLGQFYHKPLRDIHGTTVLCVVNQLKTAKSVSALNSRWVPLSKVARKMTTAFHEENGILEILMKSIQEQINYHYNTTIPLPRGLYLGYLKMQSSVDQIQVVVSSKTPNMLPHYKMRNNPHISAEEWQILKGERLAFDKLSNEQQLTSSQRIFIEEFMVAAKRLFKLMDVHGDDCLAYRMYDFEVVELNKEVSVLVVVPPAECSCAVPGQKELLLQRGDLISISVQSFEMNHLRTYQSKIIEKYSRLSCILELEMVFANHSHREAFSSAEVQVAKDRIAKLQDLVQGLNTVWKGVRWVMDVISFARDRSSACSAVTIENVTRIWRQCGRSQQNLHHHHHHNPNKSIGGGGGSSQSSQGGGGGGFGSRHLLELPTVGKEKDQNQQQQQKQPMKTSPGRGSWPGPTVSDGHVFLDQEHSRSEQQLASSSKGNLSSSQQFLSVFGGGNGAVRSGSAETTTATTGRKNSADSNCSQSETTSCSSAKTAPYRCGDEGSATGLNRLQGSRSEDTLNYCREGSAGGGRKRTTTSSGTVGQQQQQQPGEEEGEGDMRGAVFRMPRPVSLHQNSHRVTEKENHKRGREKRRESAEEVAGGGGGEGTEFSTIQVYAAYETGLVNGTSLKLHVTTATTTREVIDLVVKQLNMAVLLKGREGPIYGEEDLGEFCLVAIIGARERCLRDDFRPLQLQNPWRKGRLYVRKKMDVLAALEHNNHQAKMI